MEASKHCPGKRGWQFLASPNLICRSLKGQYFKGIHNNSYCKGFTHHARLWCGGVKGSREAFDMADFSGFLGTPCPRDSTLASPS